MNKEFEFHEIVAKVEERFRKVYDGEKVAKAVTEGQMAPDEISTGWWVVLSRFGIAIRFGDMKPDIAAGDTLVLVASKIPKAPPQLAITPAPAAPGSPGTATVILPSGYASAEAFAEDCGFELAKT